MSTLSLGADSRMREMMRQRGVDALELYYDEVGTTSERAREVCAQCVSTDTCLDWLAANRNTETPEAPEFCPNTKLFEQFSSN
jgi:uncharacterized protein DUF6455